MRALALLALLASGCLARPEGWEVPGQDEAVSAVWEATYGRWGDEPPAVDWMTGSDLDPVTGKFFADGDWQYGLFTNWQWRIRVGIADPGGQPISSTPFAHELLHACLKVVRGDSDHDHLGPDWTEPDGLLARAQAALKEKGL